MKNLPIRLFETRRQDLLRNEPNGSKQLPKWVLDSNPLLEKSNQLKSNINQVFELYKKNTNQKIPFPLSVIIHDFAKAKSHREDICMLFYNELNENTSFSVIGDNEIIFKITEEKQLKLILSRLETTEKFAKQISAIEEIKKFKPIINNANNSETLKIKLFNYADKYLNSLNIMEFENKCRECNIQYERKQYFSDLEFFKITNASLDDIKWIEDYNGVKYISKMPEITLGFDELGTESSIEIKEPNQNESYPTIGVLDSGISDIPHFSKWITDKKHFYASEELDTSHGTATSSIIVYNDILNSNLAIGCSGAYIFDAAILPNLNNRVILEDEYMDNIKEVISENHNKIKIWNMSCGTNTTADTQNFSDFAVFLDKIQSEKNVLIIKSAGNSTKLLSQKETERIPASADSVRSLVIGAIAHEKNTNDYSNVGEHSLFSRIGPGPGSIVKPDLVHYGGNIGLDTDQEITISGVKALDTDGNLTSKAGTSFSTPRITATIATLSHKMNEDFNPLLLKALTIHNANYPQINNNLPLDEKLQKLGFGLTPHVDEILYNDENEITLILDSSLKKGQRIDVFDLPFPDELNDGEYYFGEITLTLVCNSILNQNSGYEYIQSNIDVRLGTYDSIVSRDTSKRNILNEYGRVGNQNLFASQVYSKKTTTGKILYDSQRILKAQKYHPVKKYEINLQDLTPANKEKYLSYPKKWFLEITGSYRREAERLAEETNSQLSQDFCLIMTIKDPTRSKKVYNLATRRLEATNFIHRPINIHEEIQMHYDSEE